MILKSQPELLKERIKYNRMVGLLIWSGVHVALVHLRKLSAASLSSPNRYRSISCLSKGYSKATSMSSLKDFKLDITLVDNGNLATYTVLNIPSHFIRFWKVPLVAILCGTLVLTILRLAAEADYVFEMVDIYIPLLEIFLAEVDYNVRGVPVLQSLSDGAVRKLCLITFIVVLSCIITALISLQEPQDSIMVIKDVGIQLSSRDMWGFTKKEFIPLSDTIDIVIHEGFYGFAQVIFYMCVLTLPKHRSGSEENGIKIVFPNFLPRKPILVDVCRQSREMLFGTTKRYTQEKM